MSKRLGDTQHLTLKLVPHFCSATKRRAGFPNMPRTTYHSQRPSFPIRDQICRKYTMGTRRQTRESETSGRAVAQLRTGGATVSPSHEHIHASRGSGREHRRAKQQGTWRALIGRGYPSERLEV